MSQRAPKLDSSAHEAKNLGKNYDRLSICGPNYEVELLWDDAQLWSCSSSVVYTIY